MSQAETGPESALGEATAKTLSQLGTIRPVSRRVFGGARPNSSRRQGRPRLFSPPRRRRGAVLSPRCGARNARLLHLRRRGLSLFLVGLFYEQLTSGSAEN